MRRLGAIAVVSVALAASADELPLQLQVQLLQKTAAYITSLQPGDTGKVKVLVVHAGDKPTRVTEQLTASINGLGQLGKHPAEAAPVALVSLKTAITSEKPQMLFLAPDLDEKGVAEVLEACGTANIVTVSAVQAHVKQGIILGFDLQEAKPRILVHLKQARSQSVVFLSGLLTHSVIVEK